jgi:hypothetical protein
METTKNAKKFKKGLPQKKTTMQLIAIVEAKMNIISNFELKLTTLRKELKDE